MTIIKLILAAMANNTLLVGPSEVRAIKHYVRNSNHRHTQEEIEALIAQTERGWKLTQEFEVSSILWFHKLCYTKAKEWRDTIQTRRFGNGARLAIEQLTHFELCGISTEGLLTYDSYHYQGKERWVQVYPIFRICPSDVRFICIPWQNSTESGIWFI